MTPYLADTMDRRFFSKLLALSAGSLGLGPVAGGAAEAGDVLKGDGGDRGKAQNAGARPPEPVNAADFQALAQAALPTATYEYITTGSTDEEL